MQGAPWEWLLETLSYPPHCYCITEKSLPPEAFAPQFAMPLKDARVDVSHRVKLVVAVQPAAQPVYVLCTPKKEPLTIDEAKVGLSFSVCCALHEVSRHQTLKLLVYPPSAS